jgi:hypothetical protein
MNIFTQIWQVDARNKSAHDEREATDTLFGASKNIFSG